MSVLDHVRRRQLRNVGPKVSSIEIGHRVERSDDVLQQAALLLLGPTGANVAMHVNLPGFDLHASHEMVSSRNISEDHLCKKTLSPSGGTMGSCNFLGDLLFLARRQKILRRVHNISGHVFSPSWSKYKEPCSVHLLRIAIASSIDVHTSICLSNPAGDRFAAGKVRIE